MAIDDRPFQLDQLMSLAWGRLMMQKRFVEASAVSILGYFSRKKDKTRDFGTSLYRLCLNPLRS